MKKIIEPGSSVSPKRMIGGGLSPETIRKKLKK